MMCFSGTIDKVHLRTPETTFPTSVITGFGEVILETEVSISIAVTTDIEVPISTKAVGIRET
jgi:hypothetical protein